MKLRSLLFVPADSERKFAKATGIGADALILDLEDSVAAGRKAFARGAVKELLPEVLLFRRMHPGNMSRTRAPESRAEYLRVVKAALDRRRRETK